MPPQLVIRRGVTERIPVSLGFDVSGDTITSKIRETKDKDSDEIATWDVDVVDAPTGELLLTLDDSVTGAITKSKGYMDLRRLSGSEPLGVFERPLEVVFIDHLTD